MKIDRHGQAKILTQAEIQLLFSQGLTKLNIPSPYLAEISTLPPYPIF